ACLELRDSLVIPPGLLGCFLDEIEGLLLALRDGRGHVGGLRGKGFDIRRSRRATEEKRCRGQRETGLQDELHVIHLHTVMNHGRWRPCAGCRSRRAQQEVCRACDSAATTASADESAVFIGEGEPSSAKHSCAHSISARTFV